MIVAVVGGGPAGLAAAIALVRSGHKVTVFDRVREPGPRVGETLAPEVRHLLKLISVEEGFDAIPSVPFVGTRSVWGGDSGRSAILNPLGSGLHVDRAAFDSWFEAQAVAAGVVVRKVSRGVDIAEDGAGWLVGDLRSDYLVDARGRSATGSLPPRKWVSIDRLVGIAGWMWAPALAEPELLIEAVEQGWWYSAMQPEGGMVATLMTDADLIAGSGVAGLSSFWAGALDGAPLTRARLADCQLSHPLMVQRADSGYSLLDRGPNWRAVGDAATAWDPLAGTGIARAIQSGIAAANFDETPAPPPVDYLETRAKYYGMESGWPEATFWLRRRAVDLTNFEVFLAPDSLLGSGSLDPARQAQAESLLPHRALRDFLRALNEPVPAHVCLGILRERCGPLGDQRLLAGLQLLVLGGVLRVAD